MTKPPVMLEMTEEDKKLGPSNMLLIAPVPAANGIPPQVPPDACMPPTNNNGPYPVPQPNAYTPCTPYPNSHDPMHTRPYPGASTYPQHIYPSTTQQQGAYAPNGYTDTRAQYSPAGEVPINVQPSSSTYPQQPQATGAQYIDPLDTRFEPPPYAFSVQGKSEKQFQKKQEKKKANKKQKECCKGCCDCMIEMLGCFTELLCWCCDD